jgi:LPS export ABC transporter protein LptC
VTSWLEADYAIRKDKDKKFYVKENVVLYNKRNDKLETDELIWNEELEEIYTNKPVKITQPSIGDTSFGFGFKADQEFTRFEISRKFSGIKNVENLTKELKKK